MYASASSSASTLPATDQWAPLWRRDPFGATHNRISFSAMGAPSGSGLGRSNTYAGRSKLRGSLDPVEVSEGPATAGGDVVDSPVSSEFPSGAGVHGAVGFHGGASQVRRHASMTTATSRRAPPGTSSPTATATTTRTGKPRAATSSLTIDTATGRTRPPGRTSPDKPGSGQTTPLAHSPISANPLGRTPWSPTAEEAAKLISQKASIENTREAFESMDLQQQKQQQQGDQQPQSRRASPQTATSNASKRLPPLTTSFVGTSSSNGPGSAASVGAGPASANAHPHHNASLVDSPGVLPYRGPSSAAAFVRPIGGGFNQAQSRVFEEQPNRNIPLHNNGAATAVVGSGASSWLQQKALIAGGGGGGAAAAASTQREGGRRRTELEEVPRDTIDEETRSYSTDSPPDFNQPLPYPHHHHHHQSLTEPFMSTQANAMSNFAYDQPAWMNGLHTNALAALAQSQTFGGGIHNHNNPNSSNSINQSQTPFNWSMGPSQHVSQQQQRSALSPIHTGQASPFPHPFMPPTSQPNVLNQLYNTAATTPAAASQNQGFTTPFDVQSMAMAKGWNPPRFDCKPKEAKFCVIKSYTEDDIHKSIKYEIWSSTKLGNQRLDRVFREGSPYGPVYLLFSVNGSGHFAGIAEMLTPVDESVSSNVWTDSKWKGIFKLRWIYIKDVPNHVLRHLRLSNTQENKPVTSSRDTQEVPYDVGCEMLRLITSYNSKTSLLQDFAFYELKSSQMGAGGDQSTQQTSTAP